MNQFTDNHLDHWISKTMMAANTIERKGHISSGKLSASMLGKPLQWQILKNKGVPTKPIDEYVLRKFQRGKDVEAWLVGLMPGILDKQKFIQYRNCVGYIDAFVDSEGYDFQCGVLPHEIKSVANMKFKKIEKDKVADRSHILQACMYALAMETKYFAIDYVASDDYRIMTLVYETADYQDEVNRIITDYDKQLASGSIPIFNPPEMWMRNPEYSDYPWAMNLSENEIIEYIKVNYPNIKL